MNKILRNGLLGAGFFLSILLFTGTTVAQTVIKVNGDSLADVKNGPLAVPNFMLSPIDVRQIISHPPGLERSGEKMASSPESKGKFTSWLEYGDGNFTQEAESNIVIKDTPKYNMLLRVAPLYDTSRGKDFTLVRSAILPKLKNPTLKKPDATLNGNEDEEPLPVAEKPIKLTVSSGSIVKNEPISLAVTYKLPSQFANNTKHYAVLYYDNTTIFETLIPGQSSYKYSNTPNATIDNVRFFENVGQSLPPVQPTIPDNMKPKGTAFAVQLNEAREARRGVLNYETEHNFFVTLKTVAQINGLEVGEKTRIIVILVAANNSGQITKLAADTVSLQYREGSFDPNHLSQSPACLLLPKKEQPLTYKVQFQNLGKGPADLVKIVFHRPEALRGAAFNLQSYNFAGQTSTSLFTFTANYDRSSNTDTFLFTPVGTSDNPAITLKGTNQVSDPLNNPATMGEVNFTLVAPASVGDTIQSYADIYFHSQFNPNASAGGRWEDLVSTNTATSIYRAKPCECDNICPPNTCHIILGLCWWWWVIILLALLLLIWLLRRRRRS